MLKDISVKNVNRLDGKNYQVWKFQITALLIANGIYDVVTGDRVRSPNDVTNEANHKKWIKDDARAKVIISTSMIDSELECLLTCTSAKGMWDILINAIHEQKSATNKLILTQRFHEYRMKSTDSVIFSMWPR